MEIGESGQNGELVPFPNVEANKHGKEVATILLLLMVDVTAQALVMALKVLCFCAFYNASIFIQLIRLWRLDSLSKKLLQTLGE